MNDYTINFYRTFRPISSTFLPKNVIYIRPASYAPSVSIISKLKRIEWKQPWRWF